MHPRIHPSRLWFLAIIASITLLPASALAQAGLSGDPFSGQSTEAVARDSKFDNGSLQSQSALGQLEEMTGATVDRSSGQNTVTRVAPRPKPVQPHLDPNLMIKQQIAGALADALVGALFSDNSAQEEAAAQAEAQAQAEAAAQAEAFRVQQELARQARIRQALHYRAEWDSRETEITNQLGGAFDVGAGTAFFGQPANPNAETVAAILGQDVGASETASGEAPEIPAADPSVVDLRGSSMVVQPLLQGTPAVVRGGSSVRTSVTPGWTYDSPDAGDIAPPARPPSQGQGLLSYFGPWLGDWYKDFAKDTAKETVWGFGKRIPGQPYAKALFEFNEQRVDLTNEMNEAYSPLLELAFGGATKAANSLGNPYSSGEGLAESQFDSIHEAGSEVILSSWKMAFKQFTGHFGGLDLGELKTESGAGNVVPVNDVPVHPDYARLMFGSRG
jgi:hypothetical protein